MKLHSVEDTAEPTTSWKQVRPELKKVEAEALPILPSTRLLAVKGADELCVKSK